MSEGYRLSCEAVTGITPIGSPQLLLGYYLRRQAITVFFENIVHAVLGAVRLFVEAAFFLLMAVVGCAHGHHFLPAVTHLLFLHVEYSSRCGGKNGLLKVLSPYTVIAQFQVKL
jgi:hypothetical protein